MSSTEQPPTLVKMYPAGQGKGVRVGVLFALFQIFQISDYFQFVVFLPVLECISKRGSWCFSAVEAALPWKSRVSCKF